MGDTIVIETPVATVLEVTGLQGPQGVPGASQADVLTVQGDLLYRGASAAQRLGIGTAGQILKVNSGGTAPEWGAASAAGVSSVNGQTGAVDLDAADISAAYASHDHQPADIYCDAAKVTATTLSAGEPNGVYFRDGSDNGKATYKSAAGYSIFWDDAEGEWVLGNVSQSHKYFIGSQDTTYPWQVSIAWTLGAQGSGTVPNVAQATLTDYQVNAAQDAVSTRVPKSGNATSTEVVLGSDTRLTNSRVPTVHAASHGPSGSDPLFDQDLNTTDSPTFASLSTPSITGDLWESSTQNSNITFDDNILQLNADGFAFNGLGALAAASHTHGNLTNDGKIGSTAGLPVVTTTAGAVTTLALGTANQVLRVNSGASGVEFADPAASGVTGAAASASDVLGVSGANITGVDAGSADRLVFWDDSAGKLTHLSLGSNALSIDGTTLKSQPMFSVDPISRGATYIPYIGSGSNGNSSAAVNTGVGYVLFSPVYIRKSANYTTFSCIVASAGSASSLGKMALYSIKTTDATPDALVCESGTFATDSTGIKQPTMASTFVSEGWYYMALATNSTTNVLFYGDTMLLLRGVFSGAALNTPAALFDYSSKLYADLWPNPWNGTGSTFRNAFHPITSLT